MTFMQHQIDYRTVFGSASCMRSGPDVCLHVLCKTTMVKRKDYNSGVAGQMGGL